MVESKLDLKRGEDRRAVKLMDGAQICQWAEVLITQRKIIGGIYKQVHK